MPYKVAEISGCTKSSSAAHLGAAFDSEARSVIKLIQNGGILHLKPSRLGPPGRKKKMIFFILPPTHLSEIEKKRPSFSLSVMKKNPLTLTDIKK